LFAQYAVKSNNETIAGLWTFSQPPVGINPGGSPNATASVNGLVQLATAAQAASSTVVGSTGANDVLWSKYATDTRNIATAASNVLMSDLTGYLNQAWINLTQAFTFTGLVTFNGLGTFNAGVTSSATTTLAGSNSLSNALVINGVPYAFPSAQGGSGQTLINGGSGTLQWSLPRNNQYALATTSTLVAGAGVTVTSTALNVPANTLSASSTIVYTGTLSCTSGGTQANDCVLTAGDGSNTYISHTFVAGGVSSGCAVYFTITIVATSMTSQLSNISGIQTCNNTFAQFTATQSSSVNFAAATSFLLKLSAVNSTGNASNLYPFTIVANP
jgi:hypothetical protein